MLKIFVGLFLLVFASCIVDAQSGRVYLTGSGEITTNRQLASSYVDITKLAQDSAWFVRQFDLKDTLLSTGYYKDAELRIPHGKFIYYRKIAWGPGFTFMGKLYVDSINYIHYSGCYINGVKTGTWLEYLPGGLKTCLRTYKNNLLDGLFQKYSESGKVAAEGYYVNNKKEGDWFELDEDSTVRFTLVFKHDKLVNQTDLAEYVKRNRDATPKFDFGKYISHIANHYTYPISNGKLTISFIVTKDGVANNPKVVESYEPQFDKMITDAILNSARWKPALLKGQPVDEVRYCTINILNSAIQLVSESTFQ
ncbi:MAG TPA: energy transducer TonB [Mucilaginibacter sp.]|jgi:antitoxin component YwqK of YwqJK toxin-antitoxin module